jgi:hypothetical protein
MLGRAAQYETLRAELTVLSQRVVRDREEGASTKPFSWQLDGSLMDVIDELRSYEDEDALPARLGRDSPDESTSALALRTVSHVALVTLSALPGLAMPLGRVTTPLRLPFLSVAGTAGKSLLANLAVVFSFGAATWYLATRVITADNNRINEARAAALAAPPGKHLHYAHPVYLGELRSPAVLAMLISALVVLGVLLVPAARTFRSSRRLKNLAWGLALLATAGAIPFVFGWRDSGLAVTLTGSGGFRPTGTVLELMFAAAAVGAVGSKITPLIGYIKKLRDARTWTVSALAIAASIFLLVWSAPHLLHAFNDGRWYSWHRASALAALLSMPVLVMYAFAVSWARATAVALGATRKSPPVRLARRVKSRFAGDAPVGQREG